MFDILCNHLFLDDKITTFLEKTKIFAIIFAFFGNYNYKVVTVCPFLFLFLRN